MKFEDLVIEKGYDISFEGILEPRTKGVRLRILVNKSEDLTDLLIHPDPNSEVTTLQIDFPNYVTYSVIYDDFTIWNDDEGYKGEAFRIYEKSSYFDFIRRKSTLPDKNLKHFSLACIEHKVDIISEYELIISKIN
ncbi:hypothetical protein [Virgibacillus sp. JSM 102003]|uniref:hypothetical protein n=1 Tax=Virgibacillus sp. JSM 102003 TaxID=1562108 RepID=UPI0035C0A71A